jgi:hypothetical protein
LHFEDCSFANLSIKKVNCETIKINDSNFNKVKIEELKSSKLAFNNVDFNENSRILFERID